MCPLFFYTYERFFINLNVNPLFRSRLRTYYALYDEK